MAPKNKQANISKVLPPIPPHSSKKILEKSQFFIKNLVFSLTKNLSKKSLYAQASKININEIIRISEIFLKLLANKVLEIHKVLKQKTQIKHNYEGFIQKASHCIYEYK